MGRNPSKEDTREFLEYLRSGRDQMDLLECSVSGADKKPDFDTRSLSFARQCKHPQTGEPVDRSWLVTFSAEYGRPTPKDDDVFVALMKVSQAAGLMKASDAAEPSPRVNFSCYQLIKILDWPDNGQSYQAIEDALKRLKGVVIVARNYRWDPEVEEFFDAGFNIIDEWNLYERDKYDRALKKARAEGKERPRSAIWWSSVMLESFQAGNVRRLDLEVYNSLSNPIARKLYRYLGKQFWTDTSGRPKRRQHRISIHELCHEKLGYRESEKRTSRLKDKVRPAIEELESRGIYGLEHEFDQEYGRCDVVFKCQQRSKAKEPPVDLPPLVAKLVELRVRREDAEAAVSQHEPERIIEDIEDALFRERKGLLKGTKAGCLASMLKASEPWDRPPGFESSIERERKKRAAAARRQKEREEKNRKEAEEAERTARMRREFNAFLGTLSDEERESYADQAVSEYRIYFGRRIRESKRAGEQEQVEQLRHDAMEMFWSNQRTSSESDANEVDN